MKHSTYISVTNEFVGFHQWINAPKHVSFLRNSHRHQFKFKSTIEVTHQDREVEFFTLQANIDSLFEGSYPHAYGGCDFKQQSCEMLAKDLAFWLLLQFPARQIMVTCSEDGENEATVILKGEKDEKAILPTT